MKLKLNTVAIGAALSLALAGAVLAQPYGMGPGMMGGYGGGYGPGPGMMGGYGGGYGPGPGMMGGYGGMGPGMMGGADLEAYAGLDLTPEQRQKIDAIREETAASMWQLMGTMHGQRSHMRGMFTPGAVDEAEARKSFETMTETQKAMFELQLGARKRIDAVLTDEQRAKLRRYWSGR